MTFDSLIQIIGWAMFLTPLGCYLAVSFWMIKGAAADDEQIMMIVILGLSIMIVGAVILGLYYFSDFSLNRGLIR